MNQGLRWIESDRPNSTRAHSGKLQVGAAVKREADDGSTEWGWRMSVSTRWICKGNGASKTKAHAKRAIRRAWQLWLAHAALTPVAAEETKQ